MSASAKPAEKVLKSFLAAVLAVSFCPLTPDKAQAQEASGGGVAELTAFSQVADEGEVAGFVEDSVAIGNPDDDSLSAEESGASKDNTETGGDGFALQSSESSEPIVDWTTSGTCQWMIDASGCLTVEPLPNNSYGELPMSSSDYELPWNNSYGYDLTAINVKPGVRLVGEQSSDVSMDGMFRNCFNLVSVDLSGFDTSNVTDMGCMFNYCRALKTVNMDGLDTSNVTGMEYMFNGCPSLEALGVSGWDTSHVTNMEHMFSDCSSLTALDDSGWDTSSVTDMGWMFADCSSLAALDVSGWDTSKTTDMHNMFSGCSSLASPDISGWNTSSVTNMSYMFNGCESFSLLDLSGFNTSQVTDMSYMFSHCTSLRSLDLSSFDTSNVTNMNGMFTGWGEYGGSPMALEEINLSGFNTSNTTKMKSMFGNCSKLTSLDISRFSTSNVTDMSSMFSGCSSLKSLDLSLFDTSNVADMVGLFSGCSSLASIDLSSFSTSNVTDMSRMFYSCQSLESLDLSRFDFSHVTSMDGMLYQCSGLRSISVNDGFRFVSGSYDKYQSSFPTPSGDGLTGRWVSSADGIAYEPGGVPSSVAATYTAQQEGDDARNQTGTCLWRVDGAGTLVIEPLSGKQGDLPGASYMSWPWKAASDDVRAIVVLADVVAPTNDYGMFSDLPYLKTADLSGLDTSCATNMHSMFYGCSSLQTIKLSDLSTSNVTDMGAMFYNCSSLESLDLSGFDTSRVTDMSFMFRDCSSLATLDLSGFNTGNVANMQNMFSGCSFLKELDLSSFDTGKVTKMNELFYGCRNLKTTKLGKLNTSKVTSTHAMFYECSSLESLDLSSLDTSRDLDMGFMFSGCSRLSELDLSSFDTSSVTDMESMFQSCGAAHLDLSKFNTSSVTDMSFMFNMARAQSIDLSSFDTSRVTKMSNMFGGGSSLRSVVLGGKFTFNGRDTSRMCSLPTPYFTNATGLWVSSADGKAYAPDSIPNNVAATYTAQVKGEAAKTAISKSMFTVDTSAKTYTGFQIAPEVSSNTLQRGIDYTVSYGTNVNAGPGTVTVTGAGNYTGTLSYSFTIDKAVPSYTVPSRLSAVYGQTLGDVTLPAGFSWQDGTSTKVGGVGHKTFLATYTPVDTANYETVRDIEVGLDVTPAPLAEDDFSFDLGDAVYTGDPVVGRVSSKTLAEGTDYGVAYVDNVNAGTASVTVTGIGNYEGSAIAKHFAIKKADPFYKAPAPISATEGQTLRDLNLPGGFSWQDDLSKGVGEAGEHVFMAKFTPDDTANYNVVEDIPVTVVVAESSDGWKAIGDCAWKVDDQGCLIIKPANGVSGTLENFTTDVENYAGNLMPKTPWEDRSDDIVSARFEKGVTAGPSLGCIFWQLCKLESVDFSNLDMSNVRSMRDAFRCCESLKKIDGLGSKGKMVLEDATEMFSLCRSLEEVDLSDVDLSGLDSAAWMFADCSSLEELDLPNFGSKSSQYRYLSGMLYGCSSLKRVDLSGLDTRGVRSMRDMFSGCTSLKYVKLGENFSFCGAGPERLCSLPAPWEDGATGLWRDAEGQTFAPSEVPDGAGTYTAVFPELSGGWKAIGGCAWKIDDWSCLIIKPTNGVSGELAEWSFDYGSGKASTPWRERAAEITSVVIEDGVIEPSDAWGMFEGCSNLVSADLRRLVVPGASNLRSMFAGCSSLKTLALPERGVPQVDDLRYAFMDCSSLESVDLSAFKGSTAWNSMAGAFLGCTSLKSIDLSGLDTSKVANMDDLFAGCSSLESVLLSGVNTLSVNTMKRMFDGCASLENVTLGESFSFCGSGTERQCSLPTPSGELYTGKWVDVETGEVYSAAGVPDGKAATYRAQRRLLESDFAVDVSDAVYSGEAVGGRVSSSTLKEGADYDVAYFDNVDAGIAAIAVTGKGLYAGSLSYSFEIAPAAITAGMVSGVPSKMEAKGEQLTPPPTVTFNGAQLVEGTDYTVSYGENVDPGKGTVTVAAVEGGNFTGSATAEFVIEKKAEPDPGTGGGGTDPAPTPDPGTGGGSGGGGDAPAPAPVPQQFAVTYHLDGGVNATANPAAYTAGTAVTLADPTKDGYEFQGWYADSKFEKRVTEVAADSTGDVELWAKWKKEEQKPAPVFPDVDYSSWYGKAVTYVASKGLITGYAAGDKAGQFGVGDTLTRAQLATILWRNACPEEAASYDAASAKDATGIAGSADGMYYTAAANWAVKNGVISGFVRDDGTKDFAADDDVSFEQLVTILARLCATPAEIAAAGSDLSAFADGADASGWSRNAFAWAASKGLVEGYDTPTGKLLSPGEDVARERVAVVLMRAFEMGILK